MLWLDVGLGKTITLASMLADYFAGCCAYRALVLSTKAIAQSTWQDELLEWEHTHNIPSRSLVGVPRKDLVSTMFAGRRTSRIDTLHYDQIGVLEAELKARNAPLSHLYDVVICDEITFLKNGNGKRFQAMARMVQHVPYFWGLTGSPAAEGYHHLWAPMYLVDNGYRLGVRQSHFKSAFFTDINGKSVLAAGAKEQIHEILRDVVMVLDGRDYGVVPELIPDVRKLHFTPGQQSEYDELQQTMVLELGQDSIIAANAGVLLNKCLQYTSGAMYIRDDEGNVTGWESVHDLKLDMLASLYDELNGVPLLVGVQYLHEVERIMARFPQAVHATADNIGQLTGAWNTGQLSMMVAHPKTCGHGLNLQKGGHHLCWYTLPWSLEQFEQMIGRLRRSGQVHPVIMHTLMVMGSVDEQVYAALTRKQRVQDGLKAAMAA